LVCILLNMVYHTLSNRLVPPVPMLCYYNLSIISSCLAIASVVHSIAYYLFMVVLVHLSLYRYTKIIFGRPLYRSLASDLVIIFVWVILSTELIPPFHSIMYPLFGGTSLWWGHHLLRCSSLGRHSYY